LVSRIGHRGVARLSDGPERKVSSFFASGRVWHARDQTEKPTGCVGIGLCRGWVSRRTVSDAEIGARFVSRMRKRVPMTESCDIDAGPGHRCRAVMITPEGILIIEGRIPDSNSCRLNENWEQLQAAVGQPNHEWTVGNRAGRFSLSGAAMGGRPLKQHRSLTQRGAALRFDTAELSSTVLCDGRSGCIHMTRARLNLGPGSRFPLCSKLGL
jgi:hypothetical protein